jgi:DNA-binding GntR family transcriptional regulator
MAGTVLADRGDTISVPRSSEESAYRALARELRSAVRAGRYGDKNRLPTDAELAATGGLSRQTVRRAMQELVNEGLVFRVPGRGTFPVARDNRYLRQFGSVEDLIGLSEDTLLELVSPLQRRLDLAAAGRLGLDIDVVSSVTFLRLHDGLPLCFTTVALPPAAGRLLADVPELHETGATTTATILGLLDARMDVEVVEADQSISVAALPADAAAALRLPAARPVLRIDRLYSDEHRRPVELAVNWFHPDHYSYRVRLRRSGG